jgi:hypothetical protein
MHTFSGAHPFRPSCLKSELERDAVYYEMTDEQVMDDLAWLVSEIERGWCPRCEGRLPDGKPEFPAGSQISRCRCIPVCGDCGRHEQLSSAIDGVWYTSWNWVHDRPDVSGTLSVTPAI